MRWLIVAAVCLFFVAPGLTLYPAATFFHRVDFGPLTVLLGLFLLIAPVVLAVFIIVGIVRSLWHRRWRHLIIYSLVPPIAFVSLVAGGRVDPVSITPWELRFRFNHDAYLRETARATEGSSGPDLLCFDWGVDGWALSSDYSYLVFDSSDEIARATTARSEQWVAQFKAMLDRPCIGSDAAAIKARMQSQLSPVIEIEDKRHLAMIKPLGGHYYFVWTHY